MYRPSRYLWSFDRLGVSRRCKSLSIYRYIYTLFWSVFYHKWLFSVPLGFIFFNYNDVIRIYFKLDTIFTLEIWQKCPKKSYNYFIMSLNDKKQVARNFCISSLQWWKCIMMWYIHPYKRIVSNDLKCFSNKNAHLVIFCE